MRNNGPGHGLGHLDAVHPSRQNTTRVTRAFTGRVRERALGAEVSGALNPAQQVVKIVNEELIEILGGSTRRLALAKTPPTVILLAGLQGAGKTSLAGKLAKHLQGQGHQPLLVAADLQRPNAVDQLRVVGQQAGVPVYAPEPGNGVGDPVAVARGGVDLAVSSVRDIVIIDTAGRLAIDTDLMDQLRRVKAAVDPDETLLVIDAMIGQDAVTTADTFAREVGIDGVILTKLDGDARGGAALSVVTVTGKPILYAAVGEKLGDLEVFDPERMASGILDMGDVLTLIEQDERAFDADQAMKMAGKVERGESFTLDDFLQQMHAVKKMGSLSKLLGMLPGMGELKDQIANLDDREMDRVAAIIQSMTPQERNDPKILNASRRQRIANGSGRTVADVNQLIERFEQAQKMMKQMRGGGGIAGLPGMQGMPGMPGGGGPGKRAKGKAVKSNRGAKGRSGNPAKRAQQQAAAGRAAESDEAGLELPEEFKNLLGG